MRKLAQSKIIATRVAAGAAVLDIAAPGWDDKINVDQLDLSDTCNCVLGQLADDYDIGIGKLSLENPQAVALGFLDIQDTQDGHRFDWDSRDRSYRKLTAAWRKLIEARRSARVAA